MALRRSVVPTRFWLLAALTLPALVGACSRETGPPAEPVRPAFRLEEYGGRVLDLSHERGRVVVVFFGYTNCPDVCPTTLADFLSVKRRLGPRADAVRFAFVTVDPGRDSPDVARHYAAQFDSTFFGLSSDSVTLAGIQRQFRAASWVGTDSTGAVVVAHSASTFVVAKDGTLLPPVRGDFTRIESLYQAVDGALRH